MNAMERIRFVLKFWKSVPFVIDYYKSKEVKKFSKISTIALIVIYFAVPTDIIADFLIPIGIIDDFGLFMFVMQYIVKTSPKSLQNKYVMLEK